MVDPILVVVIAEDMTPRLHQSSSRCSPKSCGGVGVLHASAGACEVGGLRTATHSSARPSAMTMSSWLTSMVLILVYSTWVSGASVIWCPLRPLAFWRRISGCHDGGVRYELKRVDSQEVRGAREFLSWDLFQMG